MKKVISIIICLISIGCDEYGNSPKEKKDFVDSNYDGCIILYQSNAGRIFSEHDKFIIIHNKQLKVINVTYDGLSTRIQIRL